jgi:acetylornithine deacetylase
MMSATITRDEKAVRLLKELISIPSISGQEDATATAIEQYLKCEGVKEVNRHLNNVWAVNAHYTPVKPSVLLCSHHDTVRAVEGYTRDAHSPVEEDGRLYGLGSNDAGGALVSLIETFLYFYDRVDLEYNLILTAVAEEERSGAGGLTAILPLLPPYEFAIVGEPTGMKMAVAEKSLLVVDCVSRGVSGHAARSEGDNAIYHAIEDIAALKNYSFERVSPTLGEVHMNVTMVNAGTQHNVIPSTCSYVIDIRPTDVYTNEEIMETICSIIKAEATPRNMRRRASSIPVTHPIVVAGVEMGLEMFGSPTLSDQALLSCPSLKIGPGESARSHTADEYIEINELKEGLDIYISLLSKILEEKKQ